MSAFTLKFVWPAGSSPEDPVERSLEADHLEGARLEAAMMYAGAGFGNAPPCGFQLFHRGAEVYRYPEAPRF
jgi:hypothetical protein